MMRTDARTGVGRRDHGFTLPELIVTVSVTSILLTAIAAALIAMLNISTQATTQLSEAKDVSFVQTRVPIDLGSALAASDELSMTDLVADLTNQLGTIGLALPSLDGVDSLPGSNVLTVIRPNVASPGNFLVVAYRYEQRGDDWIINRYEFSPGSADPGPIVNLVATELAAPPVPTDLAVTPWQPGDPIGFAANVTAQALGNRPAGRNLQLTFASGRTFTTGGAGLSAVQSLPPADRPGLSDPLAPPSRCGKRISIIVDTSGSVPAGNGGQDTEVATVGFIEGFIGTPTQISLNGFDRAGYGMTFDVNPDGSINLANPVTPGQRADFFPVLNDTADVRGMTDRIEALDDVDGAWNPAAVDPDGNGIHWDQIGSGTNWQAGLQNVYQNVNGDLYASNLPDLVVLITDGQPTFVSTGPNTVAQVGEDDAAAAAVVAADDLRQNGARVIGVMVGNKTGNKTYVDYLKEVVSELGTADDAVEWDGNVGADGNAGVAEIFLGGFDQLGTILRSIVIGECGGTVTVQKRVVDPAGTLTTPASGLWRYTSNADGDIGTRVLDRTTASSVTFDYTFGPGGGTTTVQLSEEPVDGYAFVGAECTVGGVEIPTLVDLDGVPEVTIDVDADAAVSCLMISELS